MNTKMFQTNLSCSIPQIFCGTCPQASTHLGVASSFFIPACRGPDGLLCVTHAHAASLQVSRVSLVCDAIESSGMETKKPFCFLMCFTPQRCIVFVQHWCMLFTFAEGKSLRVPLDADRDRFVQRPPKVAEWALMIQVRLCLLSSEPWHCMFPFLHPEKLNSEVRPVALFCLITLDRTNLRGKKKNIMTDVEVDFVLG